MRHRFTVLACLLALMLFAFGIRLYDLDGKSLWSDEGLSVHRAQASVSYILSNQITIQNVVTRDTQPPLYFLLLHGIMRAAGDSDYALKFLSVAYSVLAVPLLYVLGRRVFDRQVGLLAALLGAVSPLYLWYAQEVRMYTMLVALSLASTYALVRAGERRPDRRVRWALAYVPITAAMLYTHYSGFFLLLFHGFAFSVLALRRRQAWLLGLLAVAGLSITPLIPFVVRRLLSGGEFNYRFVPLPTILRDLWNSLILGMSVSASAPMVLALDALFLVVAVIGFVGPAGGDPARRIRRTSFLIGYLLVPILALYSASYVKPMYQSVRHLMIISPAYYLAIAVGLRVLWDRGWPLLLTGVLLVGIGAGYATHNYFLEPTYAKDDLRGMIRYVEKHSYPGDIIVLSDSVILPVFDHYYQGNRPRTAMPPFGTLADASTLEDLQSLLSAYHRVWFLYGPPGEYFDPQGMVRRWLDENLFKVDEMWFHGLDTVVAAAGYTTSSPILDRLPVDLAGPQANLGSQLRLLGMDPLPNPLAAGNSVLVNLYWRARTGLGTDFKVALDLIDEKGYAWGQGDASPFNGLFPTSRWPDDKVIRVGHELQIDPGTPPGAYWLRLRVYRSETGDALDVIGEDGNPRGQWLDLAVVSVIRPATPLSGLAVTPQYPFHARWVGGLRLLGFDLVSHTFAPGGELPLAVYYVVDDAPERDYVLRIELVDAAGQVSFGIHVPPIRADFPTSRWTAGDVVKGQHNPVLPASLTPGSYRVRLSLIEPESDQFVPVRYGWWPLARRSVNLTSIQAQARARVFQAPPIQYPLDVSFGDSIRLLGFDLSSEQASPGQALNITLYWGARAALVRSYKVTAQLLSDEGRIAGQDDAVPVDWTRPTTGWLPGEVIADHHRLSVRTEALPGRYTLIVALYDEQTGERLLVTGPEPADHSRLGTVDVVP